MISHLALDDGPHVQALGYVFPAVFHGLITGLGDELSPSLDLFRAVLQGDWSSSVQNGEYDADLRKISGIPRVRVASMATVFGAIVARKLIENSNVDLERLGVAVSTTTATVDPALRFEGRGLAEGWDLVDPLLLPHTIPNAVSSQIAIAIGAKAFALTFMEGILGTLHALENAVLAVINGRADAAVIIGAEEISALHKRAAAELGCRIQECQGAAGLLLVKSGTKLVSKGWQVNWLARGNNLAEARKHPLFLEADNLVCSVPRGILDIASAHRPFVDLVNLFGSRYRRGALLAERPGGWWSAVGLSKVASV